MKCLYFEGETNTMNLIAFNYRERNGLKLYNSVIANDDLSTIWSKSEIDVPWDYQYKFYRLKPLFKKLKGFYK